MTASEMSVLDPDLISVKLKNGSVVEIEELRTRQLFKLMKIITRGAGPLLLELDVDFGGDTETFVGKMLALVVMSVPEAENETLEFLRVMVRPSGLIEGRRLSEEDKERNETLWAGVNSALANPELDDTLDLIEAIVRKASGDLQSLGKRLGFLISQAQSTLRVGNRGVSSGASPEHST